MKTNIIARINYFRLDFFRLPKSSKLFKFILINFNNINIIEWKIRASSLFIKIFKFLDNFLQEYRYIFPIY